MRGVNGRTVVELPDEKLQQILKKYNR